MTGSAFRSSQPENLRDDEFRYVRELARKHAAISLDSSKQYLVHSRLMPLAREGKYSSVSAFIAELRNRPFGEMHVQAVEALATSETSFFRDHHPFEALRETIIPSLMRERRVTRDITIWSAGCASGQEPLSIAMLLNEEFPTLRGWNVKILASDLSGAMIERARSGVFRQHEVNRGLPAQLLVRYFKQDRNRWQVSSEILSKIKFFQHNLINDWTMIPKIDILFLRNILIYFDVETRIQMLGRVKRVLRNDGLLLLGTAETAFNLDNAFVREKIGRSVFYRLTKGGVR